MTTRYRNEIGSNQERESLLASSSSSSKRSRSRNDGLNKGEDLEEKDGITAKVFCNTMFMITVGGCALVAM